jgi:alpha-aminoadipate/glutamate carrier protein LysW
LTPHSRYIIRWSVAVAILQRSRPANIFTEDRALIRCPDCGAEIDVDEDEVEEGEILSCPECESELEVTQTHPVHLNPISDDLDEEEDEEEEDEDEADEEEDEEDDDLEDEEDDEE